MSYTFEQATSKAAEYLRRQGLWLFELSEVTQQEAKWVVTYKGTFQYANDYYTVELRVDTGEIVGFRRTTK